MTTEELLKVVGQAINVAKPDETEDMNAIVPAAVWRKVVDAHAALLYERARLTPPTDALAPQSGKKEEWISVSERLPDFEERVLVYRPGPYSGISMSWRSAALSDSYYGWLVPTATHWMPLPSPPASKAEGTK